MELNDSVESAAASVFADKSTSQSLNRDYSERLPRTRSNSIKAKAKTKKSSDHALSTADVSDSSTRPRRRLSVIINEKLAGQNHNESLFLLPNKSSKAEAKITRTEFEKKESDCTMDTVDASDGSTELLSSLLQCAVLK